MATDGPEFSDDLRKRALEWQVLIENDELEAGERQTFEAWLRADPSHAEALDRATTVLSAFRTLDDSKVASEYFELSVRDRIREAIANLSWSSATTRHGASALAGAAVALAIVFVAFTQFVGQTPVATPAAPPVVTAHRTALGEIETITLTDNSRITLGPGTQIEVTMSATSRVVDLKRGAAVFDVASDKDRPFTVEADIFSARVLGTVFDVRNNGGIVRLTVSEGVVEAAHPLMIGEAPSSVISRREIAAGQEVMATRDEGLSQIRPFRAETFAVWRDNRLRYNGAPLSEIVADANRYSEVPISIEAGATGIDALKATFTYDGRELEAMLASLPNLFPVTVDRSEPGAIVVRPAE